MSNAADFARTVLAAAAKVPAAGRFGADRVFVSAVWKQLGADRAALGPSLADFKSRLLDANRQLKITLARADMPGAMDRSAVAASEIRHLNSTFHFVVDPSRSS